MAPVELANAVASILFAIESLSLCSRPSAMPSPYEYSNPLPFHSDVWDPVIERRGLEGQKDAATSVGKPREDLTHEAFKLLAKLPKHLALTATARNYPHIVNKLALVWSDSKALDLYINNLLVDDRPNRVGFEFKTMQELTELRASRVPQLRAQNR
jgi:hypothetical protein